MKSLKIFILLFFIAFISCSKKTDYLIKYEFHPSFNNPVEFTIDSKKKTLSIYSYKRFHYKLDTTTKQNIKVDSLIEFHNQSHSLNNKKLDVFLKKIKSLDSNYTKTENILDGIGYRISKIKLKKDMISITSNLTQRNSKSKPEYELLDAFFKLTENEIKNYQSNFIIESTQSYFSYNEEVKKIKYKIETISENPIEYKIWGTLNGCKNENNELVEFFEKLPDNKPIIFDLSKGNFSECLYKTMFPEFKKKDIYFYGQYHVQDIDIRISSLEREIKDGKHLLPKTKQEKIIDNLLDERSIDIILKDLLKLKNRLNNKGVFSNKEQIIKTIANKTYN